ncbi:MAG: hypothetical protein KJZ93_04320 [Caldilineaceae bacterium]|nr:hypothetical protein [Caldilineaceae bacterium]
MRYPFATNPATVKIDGTAPEDRYLLDVVPQEMSPGTHLLPALQAQAIAARTYAFWHIRTDAVTPGAINNLEDYQVFIPRTADRLASADQQRLVDAAVLQNRYYLSYKESYTVSIYGQTLTLSDQDPIFAEFSADVREQTVANPPFPYLQSVADPVSSHPQVPSLDGHGHGLSQNGAGRWARGSESYRCDPHPAPCEPPPNPPLQAWSVRWQEAFQILTHYYTGINVRDANAGNKLITPAHRWLPLQVRWDTPDQRPPAVMNPGERRAVTFWIQNAGKESWPTNANVHFSCETFAGLQSAQTSAIFCLEQVRPSAPVPPGGAFSATLTLEIPTHTSDCIVGPFFDLYKDGARFAELGYQEVQESWPSYFVNIRVAGNCYVTFAPLVQAPIAVLSANEIPAH